MVNDVNTDGLRKDRVSIDTDAAHGYRPVTNDGEVTYRRVDDRDVGGLLGLAYKFCGVPLRQEAVDLEAYLVDLSKTFSDELSELGVKARDSQNLRREDVSGLIFLMTCGKEETPAQTAEKSIRIKQYLVNRFLG